MKRRSPQRPSLLQRLNWRIQDALYAGLEMLLVRVSSATTYRWGEALGELCWRGAPRFRRIIMRNLRVVFAGEKSPAELETLAHDVMRRAGGNLLSAIRTAAIPAAEIAQLVTVVDNHVLTEALEPGKGAIIVLPHMGNWEVIAQLGPWVCRPWPASTHYRPLNNPYLDARISARRSRAGMTLFSKKSSALSMAAFLRQGGGIGILGDQRVGKAGNIVPFFDRATSCTPLPELLTKRTGARAVALSMRTVEAGRWELRFHPIAAPYDTAACMAGLTEAMRTSLADVFWLQDRWAGALDRERKLSGKPANGGVADDAKPHRFLVINDDGQCELRAGEQGVPLPEPAPARNAGVAAWLHFLQAVDTADVLPLDAVYGGKQAPAALAKACLKCGVPFAVAGKRPR